jgi:hypothetical protein
MTWQVLNGSDRDYRVLGLCPSSGILEDTKEHDVSETYLVLETLRSFFRVPDDEKFLKNPVILIR